MKQLSLLARIDLDEQPSADSAAGGGGQSALLGHARSFSAATVVTDTLQQEYELRLRGLLRAVEDATEKVETGVSSVVLIGSQYLIIKKYIGCTLFILIAKSV